MGFKLNYDSDALDIVLPQDKIKRVFQCLLSCPELNIKSDQDDTR